MKLFYGDEITAELFYEKNKKELKEAVKNLEHGQQLVEMKFGDIAENGRWCKIGCCFIDQNEDPCGKICNEYNPCNGISGKCRNLRPGLIDTGVIYSNSWKI